MGKNPKSTHPPYTYPAQLLQSSTGYSQSYTNDVNDQRAPTAYYKSHLPEDNDKRLLCDHPSSFRESAGKLLLLDYWIQQCPIPSLPRHYLRHCHHCYQLALRGYGWVPVQKGSCRNERRGNLSASDAEGEAAKTASSLIINRSVEVGSAFFLDIHIPYSLWLI